MILSKKLVRSQAVVVHPFNPRTQESEVRWISEFQDRQGYIEKPCLREREGEGKEDELVLDKFGVCVYIYTTHIHTYTYIYTHINTHKH